MRGRPGHTHSQSHSGVVNQRAVLANAYQELGKELSSERIKVVGNYTLGKVIGEGAYGKVRIGTHRLSSTRVAIKQIPKALSASLTREIHHHRRLHHPNVTQLYEVIATESSIWLITELCSGGELYDYLVEKSRLSELETRQIFGELCLALHYVHTQGVVHRDLKLENVLLDERCHVKLSDFGFTREFEQGRMLETFCGTTGYAAPEMLLCKKYMGSEVDVWSLGVILYCLLVGTLPFDDDDEEVMKHKIIYEEYTDPEWLSSEVRDLIRSLLQKDPSKRLTVAQTLAHPWFHKPIFEEPASLPLSPAQNVVDLADDNRSRQYSPSPSPSPSPAPHTQLGSRILDPIKIPGKAKEGDGAAKTKHASPPEPSASSITSTATFHSASSSLSGIDEDDALPATPEDSHAGSHDFARTANSLSDTGSMESAAGAEAQSTTSAAGPSTGGVSIHRMESQSTIRKMLSDRTSPVDSGASGYASSATVTLPSTVPEEDSVPEVRPTPTSASTSTPHVLRSQSSASSMIPANFPTRTPARTKRRSVSSNLTNSPPASPELSPPPIAPLGNTLLPDYLAESHMKAPLAFSTELERTLLNNLSLMGFDTGQIVHSVLTDACDSASAIWWMLKKKVERRETRKTAERAKAAAALERRGSLVEEPEEMDVDDKPPAPPPKDGKERRERTRTKSDNAKTPTATTQPSSSSRPPVPLMLGSGSPSPLGSAPSAPDVTCIPPTPVTLSHDQASSSSHAPPPPRTPPDQSPSLTSGQRTPPSSGSFPFNLNVHLHSPSPGGTGTSTPTSPGDRASKRQSKQRAGSVSMLQRATTALSAAGLTRKKSTEAPKDETLSASPSLTAGSSNGSLKLLDDHQRPTSSSGSQHSHTNKLTKASPAVKEKEKEREREKEREMSEASTITAGGDGSARSSKIVTSTSTKSIPSEMTPDSPWTALPSHPLPFQYHRAPHSAPTPANSPGNSLNQMPSLSKTLGTGTVKSRNRASLLAAFRTWFNEDKKKGRGKSSLPNLPTIPAGLTASHSHSYAVGAGPYAPSPRSSNVYSKTGSVKSKSGNRPKRPSISSRRSSSLNSRRSSLNSINHPMVAIPPSALPPNVLSRQRSDASRRSFGTRTPTSERETSRPSSVRSFSMTPIRPTNKTKRHSKSSSTSSTGSGANVSAPLTRKVSSGGTSSPLPLSQNHRRERSGSSTRGIRSRNSGHRPAHVRSDSQASSIRSRASSRPGSFHEASENEGSFFTSVPRTGSPMLFSRKSSEDARGGTIMVAHRKSSLFGAPSASIKDGRSSWKKSWGPEPPAWQSRSMQSPQELPFDPSRPSIRDVFSNKGNLAAGDDSDWVDEDDDEFPYVGGLGQPSHPTSSSSSAPKTPTPLSTALGDSSRPAPGSPSVRTMDLPPLVGMRNRSAAATSSSKRNQRPVSYKPSEAGRAPPTKPGTVVEETVISEEGSGSRARRSLPPAHGRNAFKQAIQEEDEDEEEE